MSQENDHQKRSIAVAVLYMEEEAIRHRGVAEELERRAAYSRDRAVVLESWADSAKRCWPDVIWHVALDPLEG